jgi:hypothetical protein
LCQDCIESDKLGFYYLACTFTYVFYGLVVLKIVTCCCNNKYVSFINTIGVLVMCLIVCLQMTYFTTDENFPKKMYVLCITSFFVLLKGEIEIP